MKLWLGISGILAAIGLLLDGLLFGAAAQWGNALATWLQLEEITRRRYGWRGCPMEPDRCDCDGPFVCEACAGELREAAAEASPAGVHKGPAQPSMFPMTTRH